MTAHFAARRLATEMAISLRGPIASPRRRRPRAAARVALPLVAPALLALALLAESAVAQAVDLAGQVRDRATAAPIAGVEVVAGAVRTWTDDEGRFELTIQLPATIDLVAAGYRPGRHRLDRPPAGPLAWSLRATGLERAIEVSAELPPRSDSPSAAAVTPSEVAGIAGGADNVFRTLQALPGVTAPEDFSSRLSVRGGTPDQNLTVLDGVEVHNPYRLFGLTSAFNPETVDGFELTAGGFGAKYGDRLSSLLLIDNRYGDAGRTAGGSAAVSITDANLVLEGRLPGTAGGSWLLTGRRTYYDLVAGAFIDDDLPSFRDVQLKTGWEPRPGHRLSLFGLVGREGADASFDGDLPQERADLNTDGRNDLGSLAYDATFGDRASARTVVAWSRNVEGLAFDGTFEQSSRRSNAPESMTFADVVFDRRITIEDRSARHELTVRAGGGHVIETGAEWHDLTTRVDLSIRGDRNPDAANGSSVRGGSGLPDALDSRLRSDRAGVWLQDRIELGQRLLIIAGLRYDWSQVSGRGTVSPRLAARFRLDDHTRLTGAFGRYTQSPGYEKLLQSDYFLDLSDARSNRLASERSIHAVLGVERDFGAGLRLKAEAYLKTFDQVIVGRLETDDELAARVARYDFPIEYAASVPIERQITSTPIDDADGRAYGLDLYLSRRATSPRTRVTGWIAYTLARAEREAYGQRFPFEYDRRHAVDLVGSLRLTRRWQLGATARLASGFAYTPVLGLRIAATEAQDDPTRLVPLVDDDGLPVYTTDLGGVANLNRGRLPAYARLDLRLTFRPGGDAGRWELYAEAWNVLNRDNASSIEVELAHDPTGDRPAVIETPAGNLPFLPSFGLRLRF